MTDTLLESLNTLQRQAVEKELQPILVLAGPGTGKTRMLVARILVLIQKYSIPPEKILALTFTNKAANEMKSRLLNSCQKKAADVYTSTIHSFALDVLRKYSHKVGLHKYFNVCDREYQFRLMKNLCNPEIREDLDNKVKAVLLSIANFQMKGKNLTAFAREKYKEYDAYLKKHNVIDFNQILLLCHWLFKDHKDILAEYQHLYPTILVDEFQDTDAIQYDIIKMLAEKEKNIFVVADDDQSIYSWRGANPENINNYIEDFGIKEIDFLEINYRSGNNIIKSASQIIKDTDRVEPNKQIKSMSDVLDEIKVYLFLTESDEVDFILKKIKSWIEEGIPLKEIAIIYPFHKIGNSLEHYFIKSEIAYQMASGNSILENPFLIKLVLYLKIISDPTDEVSLEQLTENEIGLQLTRLIKNHAFKKNQSFRKALYEFYRLKKGEIDFNSMMSIKNYISQIANLVNLKSFYSLNSIIDEIFRYSQQSRFSVLSEHGKDLEKPPQVDDYKSIFHEKKQDHSIVVYHSNPQLAYLGAALTSTVLEMHVDPVTDIKIIQEKNDFILFEMEEVQNKTGNYITIPVFQFANKNRKSSLGNLFKVLQGLKSVKSENLTESYVILDLETTDANTTNCGIVEIAAVRVKNGQIVDQLKSLINPQMPISKGAQRVHHISQKDVQGAPTIDQYWQQFLDFIKNDLIIAHNGFAFDFAILDRFSRKITGTKLPNIRLDSLAIAQGIFPGQSNSIDALVDRFNLDAGTRHRALDDVKVLADIVKIMHQIKSAHFQKTIYEIHTDLVALGNFIENKYFCKEDRIFFISGGRKLISPYDETIDQFCSQFGLNKTDLLSGLKSVLKNMDVHSPVFRQEDDIVYKVKLLANEFNHLHVDEAVAHFISYLNIRSGGQDNLDDINAVSLLTLHAAKGLEFEKVILMGLEKNNIPGFYATRVDEDDDRPVIKKLEEQRRLLYVGITRGKSEVILTAVKNRGGWENESSPFLKDLNIPKVVIQN